MLTKGGLGAYIYAWTEVFLKENKVYLSDLDRYSPISWYQAMYQFIHDLKNSVTISSDTEVHATLPEIEGCNELFVSLAEDKRDLDIDGKKSLIALIEKQNFEIHELKECIDQIRANVKEVSGAFNLTSRPLPWDTFSRARAQSVIRYHYEFIERTDVISLSTLEAHDKQQDSLLRGVGGVMVIRKLEPKTIGGPIKNKPDDMRLECYQLAAIPKGTALSSPWKKI